VYAVLLLAVGWFVVPVALTLALNVL